MNFISRFFAVDPKKTFLTFDPSSADFVSVSWNQDLRDIKERHWLIELSSPEKRVIHWQRNRAKKERLLEFKNDGSGTRVSLEKREEAKDLMNIAIHATCKSGIERHRAFMELPVSGAVTMDFQSEMKALQWIQASFGTLTRALEKFDRDPSLILTAAFFSGINDETNEVVLRLIVFNLDVIYYMREDNSLQVIVFDDKNMGQGESRAPTFQQTIKVTKPQFYDEILKLTHKLASKGEIR
jgi:hypothetical protein